MRLHVLVALHALIGCAAAAPASNGSIGAVLARDEATGALVAHEVPDGLTAASAGLEPGDRIKMIDGLLVDDLERDAVLRLLRGPVGSQVTLTVVRGGEVLHLAVTRQAKGDATVRQPERLE